MFGRGIAGVAVATATTLSLAEPLTAATLGVVVLDEQLPAAAVAGMVLVFAGLAVLAARAMCPSSDQRKDLSVPAR